MKRESDQIFTGHDGDCGKHEGFATVHACKHPCHARMCGARVPKDSPHYLTFEKDNDLYLNIIDPDKPLFQLELFQKFLAWAIPRAMNRERILIHCNMGQSRSRSLALVLLARLGCLGASALESYANAIKRFDEETGDRYLPGAGIAIFLESNWPLLMGQGIIRP